jgi:hypothetical protein
MDALTVYSVIPPWNLNRGYCTECHLLFRCLSPTETKQIFEQTRRFSHAKNMQRSRHKVLPGVQIPAGLLHPAIDLDCISSSFSFS